MTDIRCHRVKLEGVWKALSLISTSQNGWTWKNVTFCLQHRHCRLLPAQQLRSLTNLTHGPEDSHLQDFYLGTLPSLHCVLFYRTKPLINCVPPLPCRHRQQMWSSTSLAAIRLSVHAFVDLSRGFDYSRGTDHMLCWMSSAAIELIVLDMRMVP